MVHLERLQKGKAHRFHLYGYTDSAESTYVQNVADSRIQHLADNKMPGEWARHILKNPHYTGDFL